MNHTAISLHERTVGDIAAELPVSIRIFEAWKIDYCCGGKRKLADACAAAGKTVELFASALDVATQPGEAVADWSGKTLQAISRYVIDSFHTFTREELATITPIASKVLGVHGDRRPELAEVVS